MSLQSIKRQLIELRAHPEPDEQTFTEAASLLRQACEVGVSLGLGFKPVGSMVNPVAALSEVNRLLAATQSEWLNVPQAAKLLGVAQSKIAEFIKAGRLAATNVGTRGKRPQWRIHRESMKNIKPEAASVGRRFRPPQEII